ncbi:MAG TPA: multiheme c-type cytochrome, partial [Longimicrobiales bacterium]|nr:multiheme c-type cytochrome [Longimicrobiales bacterium]
MLVLMAAGCVDERVVYRDRDLLDGLATGAGGFVGYSNADAKLTVCGNCHVSQQNQWVETAHAGAFVTLATSGSQRALCEGCHTVGEKGNDSQGSGGHAATGEDRYRDVQCESCHGPGEPHVRNPDGGTSQQMLARIDAAPDA